VVFVVLLSLCQVSCRQPDVVYQETAAQAQELAQKGETKKAVALLKRLYDSRRFTGYRQNLLTQMLQLDLGANDVSAAQALFREAAKRDVSLASTAVGLIEDYLSSRGRHDEIIAWCGVMQDYSFGDGIRMRLAGLHFRTLVTVGKGSEIPVAMVPYLLHMEQGAALAVAQDQFNTLMRGKLADVARQVISVVEKNVKDSPQRRGVLLSMNVDLLLASGDRRTADMMVRNQFGTVPDESVIRNLTEVVKAHSDGGDVGAADALPGFFIEKVKDRQVVWEAAASLWIKLAARQSLVAELVRRLAALKEAGFSAPFILDQTDGVYSLLLDQGTKQDYEPLYKLYDGLYAGLNDDVTRRRLIGVLLDVGFYLQKFEEALKLVETGMTAVEPNQRAMLVSKIKAHLALKKGQTDEAIANFREFMALIAKGPESEVDPVDNSRMTRDMILGLNARRIGDILTGAKRQPEAAKAYTEARGYYTKALAEFPDPKSLENQKIRKHLSEIPGR
jgi:tetratricopeptide (TPR) repeat protein